MLGTGYGEYILHSEEYCTLLSSPEFTMVLKLWRIKWSGHVLHVGEVKNAHEIFVRK
jgi:hypothetical protein